MKRFLLCLLSCFLMPVQAQNAPSPLKLQQNEIALEGRVVGVDAAKNEMQLEARSFQTRGGTRTWIKPRTKTLRLAARTKLFDERTRRAAAIGDLKVGDAVRVAGLDGGSGITVRLITWSSVEAPDPDILPALRSLLPASQKWKGLEVRVVDAGFRPRAQLFPDAKLAPQEVTWMIALRNPQSHSLRLVDFQTPDGTREGADGEAPWKLSDGTIGSVFAFDNINPNWKSFKARFEFMVPNAPADARGEAFQLVPVEIPVPGATNGVLTPGTKWKTARGSTVELARVEAVEATKHLKISWICTPPADTPDAHVSCNLSSLQSSGEPMDVQISCSNGGGSPSAMVDELFALPRGAVLKGKLVIGESAPSWRKTEFLHDFELEFPVSQIAAASPPTRLTNRPAPIEVQAPQGSARLEASHREGPYAVVPLWLSAKIGQMNAKIGIKQCLLLREARIQPEGGQETTVRFHGSNGETFWHDDRSRAAPGETGWRVLVDTPKAQTVHISATAQLASIFEGDHQIKIPVPARGQTRSLERDELGDNVVNVRKIAWVEPDRWKQGGFVRDYQRFAFGSGSRGAIVVMCDLLRVWPGSERELKNIRVSNHTSQVFTGDETTYWNSDLLESGAMSPTTISFVFPAPADRAKNLNLSFHLRETLLGQTAQFKFPGVELEAEVP